MCGMLHGNKKYNCSVHRKLFSSKCKQVSYVHKTTKYFNFLRTKLELSSVVINFCPLKAGEQWRSSTVVLVCPTDGESLQ